MTVKRWLLALLVIRIAWPALFVPAIVVAVLAALLHRVGRTARTHPQHYGAVDAGIGWLLARYWRGYLPPGPLSAERRRRQREAAAWERHQRRMEYEEARWANNRHATRPPAWKPASCGAAKADTDPGTGAVDPVAWLRPPR